MDKKRVGERQEVDGARFGIASGHVWKQGIEEEVLDRLQ